VIEHGKHLVKRFFGSIFAKELSLEAQGWVSDRLLGGEKLIWNQLSVEDQCHSHEVALNVFLRCQDELDVSDEKLRTIVAAALLHDCGKLVSGYGTYRRVGATLFWLVVPSSNAKKWVNKKGLKKLAQYRLHPELGAKMLKEAGSSELTYVWAADHHKPSEKWATPHQIGSILKECDDD